MTSYLFHCGSDGCCWLPLEPNVTGLGVDEAGETVTVLCPVCRREQTYRASPGVHLAVWRHRAARRTDAVVLEAETILKEARRE